MLTKDDNWMEDLDVLSIFPTFVRSIQSCDSKDKRK